MKAHWGEWTDYGSVQILSRAESDMVRNNVKKERVFKSRWALRDKNASARSEKNPLPLKAEARLVIGGHNRPDGLSGRLKTDLPTVQCTSVLVMLQIAVNNDWLVTLAAGDVSSALSQRKPREQ